MCAALSARLGNPWETSPCWAKGIPAGPSKRNVSVCDGQTEISVLDAKVAQWHGVEPGETKSRRVGTSERTGVHAWRTSRQLWPSAEVVSEWYANAPTRPVRYSSGQTRRQPSNRRPLMKEARLESLAVAGCCSRDSKSSTRIRAGLDRKAKTVSGRIGLKGVSTTPLTQPSETACDAQVELWRDRMKPSELRIEHPARQLSRDHSSTRPFHCRRDADSRVKVRIPLLLTILTRPRLVLLWRLPGHLRQQYTLRRRDS